MSDPACATVERRSQPWGIWSAQIEPPEEVIAVRRAVAIAIVCWTFLALEAGVVGAELDHDGGGWLMLFANGSFAPATPQLRRLRWWFDLQPRFTEDSDYEQLLVRPGIGLDVGHGASLWLGYAYINTDPATRASFDEHRIWQQLLWSTKLGSLGLQSRTRLEQRFVDTGSDTGWRARQFVKAAHPLALHPRLGLAAYDELFVDLKDTDFGADGGPSQNRLFAGFSWKLGEGGHTVVELGYLNQWIANTGRTDTMNHLASLNLLLNFP